MFINRGIDEVDVVHIYSATLLKHKKEWIIIKRMLLPLAATWMDLKTVVLNEVSQTERQKSYDTAYMWNLKGTNELINKMEIE